LETCGGLAIRRPQPRGQGRKRCGRLSGGRSRATTAGRRIANPPQVNNLPHKVI